MEIMMEIRNKVKQFVKNVNRVYSVKEVTKVKKLNK